MRRTIMMGAMSLVMSATEAFAACPVLDGHWKFSSLIVSGQTAAATDCMIQISNSQIINLLTPCASPPPDYLRLALLTPLEVGCSFQFVDASSCVYRGQLNGEIGAGSVYCSPGFGTFDLIFLQP